MTDVALGMGKARQRLRGSSGAAAWMQTMGLSHATLETLGVGLAEEGGGRLTLVYPQCCDDGSSVVGRAAVSAAGVESDRAAPSVVWSSPPYDGADVIVAPDPLVMWLLIQAIGRAALGPLLVVARSHRGGVPGRWTDEDYWARFGSVTLLLDSLDQPDPLRLVLATMRSVDAGAVIAADADGGWRTRLGGVFDAAARIELRTLLEEPPALCDIVAVAADGAVGRVDASSATVHDLDGRGRLRRVLLVEERHAAGRRGGEGVRRGSVVIRSDRQLLTLAAMPSPSGTPRSERVYALSDGERVDREPRRGAACRWSLCSAQGWVAGGAGEDGGELYRDVTAVLRATGFGEAGAEAVAAFVMLTYVHQALQRLPLLEITGGSTPVRFATGRLLADLCHGGRLLGPSRGRTLARIADETGGTIVLQEPGPLQGPVGLTEVGRFLLSSLQPDASMEVEACDGGVRTLRTFGPRIVIADRRQILDWPDVLAVDLPPLADPLPMGRMTVTPTLLDRLYVWSMGAVGGLVDVSTGLRNGLDAISHLAPAAIERAVAAGRAAVEVDTPSRLLEGALRAVRARNGRVISIVELTLEAALAGGEGGAFTPERIGRWLSASGSLDPDRSVDRRRLFGHITRLYPLAGEPGDDDGRGSANVDPLDFCKRQHCRDCGFATACGRLFPELNAARRRAD